MGLIELSILGAFDMIFYIMISGKIANQYKESKKSYIIPTILVSVLIGIVGVSSLRKYNVLISNILLFLLTFILYKKKLKEILYTYILTTIIIFTIQYLVLFTLKAIGMNISYSFKIGFISQSLGLIITIAVTKYLPIDILISYSIKKNRVFKYLILNIFVVLVSTALYWYIDIDGVLRNIISIAVLTIGIIYINFVLMENGLKNELEEQQLRTYETYLPIIHELINELRIKQHEYDNHIQALNMIAVTSENYERADKAITDYISNLKISNNLGDLIKFDNKILVGFLYSKIKSAEKLGIEFQIIIEDYQFKLELHDHELIEVIGNLINNAFETGVEDNSVIVKLSKEKDMNVIEVRNKHPYLNRESIDKIFNMGFSSKSHVGRGYGLYNIAKIVKKYDGGIEVFNGIYCEENYLVFKILFVRN
jgi:signal transduction histidine kinase